MDGVTEIAEVFRQEAVQIAAAVAADWPLVRSVQNLNCPPIDELQRIGAAFSGVSHKEPIRVFHGKGMQCYWLVFVTTVMVQIHMDFEDYMQSLPPNIMVPDGPISKPLCDPDLVDWFRVTLDAIMRAGIEYENRRPG